MGVRGPKSAWLHPETAVIRVPAVLAEGLMEEARERDRALIKREIDDLRALIRVLHMELAAMTPSKSQQKKKAAAARKRAKGKQSGKAAQSKTSSK